MAQRISLVYSGELVEVGMNPLVFANAIEGFAKLTQSVIAIRSGTGDPIEFRIHRVAQGSLDVQFLLDLKDAFNGAKDALGAIASLGDLLKQVIELTKHLAGAPPSKREADGKGNVSITNNHGVVNVFNVDAEQIVINQGGASFAEKFVRYPLMQQANRLGIRVDGEERFAISREESADVLPLRSGESLLEQKYEALLTIIKPVLQGDGMWTFHDGSRRFSASIQDERFLKEVHKGRESFSNGDGLLVELQAVQERKGGKLQARYTVLRVISHERHDPGAIGSLA